MVARQLQPYVSAPCEPLKLCAVLAGPPHRCDQLRGLEARSSLRLEAHRDIVCVCVCVCVGGAFVFIRFENSDCTHTHLQQ